MKFSILGVDVFLSRRNSYKPSLSLKDLKDINKETISYLKGLSNEEREERIEPLAYSLETEKHEAKTCLKNKGIVISPNFIPEHIMDKIGPDLKKIRDRIFTFKESGEKTLEESDVLFQKGTEKLSGYQSLSSYGKTVVQVREGQDSGMVDIFNIDKWWPSIGNLLRPYFEKPGISELMEVEGSCLDARNLNLYLNSDIKSTRGFHVDSYSKQLKGFVYLEDCLNLENGPYTYVTSSHLDTPFIRINKHISSALPNKTETPIVPLKNIVPVLAKKGSLIISDQSGSHRGFPQTPGYQRAVAVMNFR